MFGGGALWAGGCWGSCKTKRDVEFASLEVISSTCFFSPRNPRSGLLSNVPEFLPPCWYKSEHLPPGKGSEATVSQSWVAFGGCLREVWDILASPKKKKSWFVWLSSAWWGGMGWWRAPQKHPALVGPAWLLLCLAGNVIIPPVCLPGCNHQTMSCPLFGFH